jgi:hypothetical protein
MHSDGLLPRRGMAIRSYQALPFATIRGGGDLFPFFMNAAWCVRAPESFFTQIQLRGSVVGVLRAPPGRHCRDVRGFAPCAFPGLSPTRFGPFVAIKPHTSGGWGSLRVPFGEGIAGPPPGHDDTRGALGT